MRYGFTLDGRPRPGAIVPRVVATSDPAVRPALRLLPAVSRVHPQHHGSLLKQPPQPGETPIAFHAP